jgi:hypothetical protein
VRRRFGTGALNGVDLRHHLPAHRAGWLACARCATAHGG